MREFHVAVLGGGSAGLAAAVTAAREGANVLLVERHGFCGGMGSAALVHSFCGLYQLREEPGAVLANRGFPAEIEAHMRAATGVGPVRIGRVDVLPQHPHEFIRIADALAAAADTLEIWFHTEALGAQAAPGGGWLLDGICRGSRWRVRANALVDASGDAVLAEMLGISCQRAGPHTLQRPAYIFGLGGAPALGDAARLHLAGQIAAAVRRGELPAAALGMTFRPSVKAGEAFATTDLAGTWRGGDYDPLDAACLAEIETQGRAIATAAAAWLRREVMGWENSWISMWPVRAGVRESRRWNGRALLTGDDLLGGRRSAEDIAIAAWPMEFRETARGPKLRYPPAGRSAGIPLGCLRPAGVESTYVAGRCLSCDHDAQASIRVMGTCFATGQAAGLAAALEATGSDPHETPAILEKRGWVAEAGGRSSA